MPDVSGKYTPAVIVLVIAISVGWDLIADLEERRSAAHMFWMWLGTGLSLVALVVMWRLIRASRAQARSLRGALGSTRTDLMTCRAKTSDSLRGLGGLIDEQLQRWNLSPAERGIALLLLKGLPFKAIAEARDTSERTVRKQSLAIYRKAGVAGRAELSAFVFADILMSKDPRAADARRAPSPDAHGT
jgi:DNA-binding CsgD family transcriptional regulator